MKIATVKQECADGNKVDTSGKVVWVDPNGKREIQGKNGPIYFEKCLIADGPKDPQSTNSIFCEFYDAAPLKGSTVSLSGGVHVYNGEKSLQGCKVTGAQSAPKQEKAEPDWELKDYRIVLQCCSKPFAEAQARGDMTFDAAWADTKPWADNIWAARFSPKPEHSNDSPAPWDEPQDDIAF